jgi:hypothetical protein
MTTTVSTNRPDLDRLAASVPDLRARVTGEVLTPADPEWQTRRLAWNRLIDHEPAVIVRAADVGDVAVAVRFAAQHGCGLGVQATGHGPVRPVDGVLVDTSRLTDVMVDPLERTAWVSAGCTWAPVLAAAQRHGLAPLLGSSSGVGAVGYTLGGGLGWLARRFGAAVDRVRSFEVVTPDGRVVRASADEQSDLFVALRGGGGGAFGVVTGMEIELVPVSVVYAGNLLYPAEAAEEVMTAWATWIADVPEELSSAVVCMNYPPLPEVPEAVRGRSFTIVRGCFVGDVDTGRRLLDRWRELAPPMIDLWGELPFTQADEISQDPVDPLPSVVTGGWLRRLDRHGARALADATFPNDGPPALLLGEVRHIGGAVSRGDRTSTVLGHRDHELLFHTVGVPVAHEPAAIAARQRDLSDRLGVAAPYLNFLDLELRRTASAAAVAPQHRTRLAALQRRLDPSDVLRFGVDHTDAGRQS